MVAHAWAGLGGVNRAHVAGHKPGFCPNYLVVNPLPILQAAKACAVDGLVMDKNIHALFGANKAIALAGVKPMHFT